MTGILLDPDGAVDGVDASFTDADGHGHRVEIKGHLRQDRYTRFAINDEAHRRSGARGATGYVGVLTTIGGPRAVVSRILPLAEVEGWEVVHLNRGRDDPARVLPLARFRTLFTDGGDVDPATGPGVGLDELLAVVAVARAHLPNVKEEAPPGLTRTAATARDWAEAALLQWR